MYLWIYLALLAAALWALGGVISKIVISKYIKNPYILAILTGIVSLLFAGITLLSAPISFTINQLVFLSLLAGVHYILGIMFFFKALLIEEVSRVTALLRLTPLFVLILATIFLNEIFTLNEYLGILLVISGSILISLRKIEYKLKLSKAFWFMTIGSFFFAIMVILCKYILGFLNYWNYFFWFNLGCFLMALILLIIPRYQKQFISIITTVSKKSIFYVVLSRILGFTAILSSIIAISIWYVALVSAIQATEPLFTLIYVMILSVFIPKILKEELKGEVISLKLLAIFLIILGVYLIS